MTTPNPLTDYPLYADRPQRRIPGTRCVAVTMRASADGSIREYAVFSDDGAAHLGTAYYQPRTRTRSRGYAMVPFPSATDETWRNLTAYAIEIGRRNGLDVTA